ncbi:MAG: T9SS type A sorting domain-containing protein [Saprospiraceae bacterium]|nr:T9SS type A sorting domain-containing protein [Saprospiraceae bacterium]
MKSFTKKTFLPCLVVLIAFQAAQAASWVRARSGVWYYFKSLHNSSFIYHLEAGEFVYDIADRSASALDKAASEDIPSLSFLEEINRYTIEIQPDGSGEISVAGVKAVTLTAEGLADFFKESPAVFYVSMEKKTNTQDAAVLLDESGEKIGTLAPGQSSAGNVVPLGKLNDQQVNMIKRLSEAGKKAPVEKYQFRIAPNPTASATTVQVTLTKNTAATLYLVDLSGTVKKQSAHALVSGSNQIEVDLQAYPPGIYLVLLEMDGTAVSGSFIKQ